MKDYFLFILLFVVITSVLGYYYKTKDEEYIENFDNFNDYTLKESFTSIYDSFYTNVYDKLFDSGIRQHFELFNIINYTVKEDKDFQKNEIKVLDIGCGSGKHLKILSKDKFECVGMDKSMKMLQKARKELPNLPLVKGDFRKKSTFKKREFTHIICLFYTLYYSDNPDQFFKNTNYWLKPKGYLCVHLINRKMFDPVLERTSSLIPLFNPQKHSKDRQTVSKLKFNKFNYMSDWKFDKENVEFIEHFVFNDKSMKNRKNKHKFTIYPVKKYVKIAKKNGFKLHKIIDLLPANQEYNYIYIFKKQYGP